MELFVIDDFSDGSIKVVNDLSKMKHRNFIVHSRIKGKNLEVELWGTSANEDMFVKHF